MHVKTCARVNVSNKPVSGRKTANALKTGYLVVKHKIARSLRDYLLLTLLQKNACIHTGHSISSELLNQISFDPGLAMEGLLGAKLTTVWHQRHCSRAIVLQTLLNMLVPVFTHEEEPC